MKELLVISGKGGTGKTSITGSLAALVGRKLMVDCDVDASDLHLLLRPIKKEEEEFFGLPKATINPEMCTHCGECRNVCKFAAIENFTVNPFLCEGCRVCYYTCPAGAISMKDTVKGRWFRSDTEYGTLVHADMEPGQENTGKLVAVVRKKGKELAGQQGCAYIICDGPPGIGCPVIASLSGTDLALIITEPSLSGIHDLKRVLQMCQTFSVTPAVCINKYDLEEGRSGEIRDFCLENGVTLAGQIPFDESVPRAIGSGVPPVEFVYGRAATAIEKLWHNLEKLL